VPRGKKMRCHRLRLRHADIREPSTTQSRLPTAAAAPFINATLTSFGRPARRTAPLVPSRHHSERAAAPDVPCLLTVIILSYNDIRLFFLSHVFRRARDRRHLLHAAATPTLRCPLPVRLSPESEARTAARARAVAAGIRSDNTAKVAMNTVTTR